jgi:predicted RNase H-like nuclease (RuvC/YqgF family)
MGYSLAEAAGASGKSKMTIQRAIKSGKLSASRRDDESYDIDPSELHRVFPPVSVLEAKNDNKLRDDITNDISLLQAELKIRDEKIALIEAERQREREQLTEQIDDLRRRLDGESEERRKLTAILTDQRQLPAAEPQRRLGLLGRLFGKRG